MSHHLALYFLIIIAACTLAIPTPILIFLGVIIWLRLVTIAVGPIGKEPRE